MPLTNSRPSAYDRPGGHWEILQDVRGALKAKQFGYLRPLEISRQLDCTRAEAMLALYYWREQKFVGCRDYDGRWYYDSTEPWKKAA